MLRSVENPLTNPLLRRSWWTGASAKSIGAGRSAESVGGHQAGSLSRSGTLPGRRSGAGVLGSGATTGCLVGITSTRRTGSPISWGALGGNGRHDPKNPVIIKLPFWIWTSGHEGNFAARFFQSYDRHGFFR